MPDDIHPPLVAPKQSDAVEHALHELMAASERLHQKTDDALTRSAKTFHEAAVSLAEEARKRAGPPVHQLEVSVSAHPLMTAFGVAAATTALFGLLVAGLTAGPDHGADHKPPPKVR